MKYRQVHRNAFFERMGHDKAHDQRSNRFKKFLNDTGIAFDYDLRFGGDGDQGEAILYALDVFFATEDL